jgi:uncharacterized protein
MLLGPTELLIIQGSPFCNIDCSYCYLPNRSAKSRISVHTVETALKRLIDDDLIDQKISIVWHAGEPLAVPIDFYVEVFKSIKQILPSSIEVRHSMQTNATLINQAWCDFIIKEHIAIGVSIDGPKDINDLNRKTRSGKSTYEQVLKGIGLLKENLIPFHVISVISKQSLKHGKDIFEFFAALGASRLCLNIEEVEGANHTSSLQLNEETAILFKEFYQTIYDLQDKLSNTLEVREITNAKNKLVNIPLDYFESNNFGQQLRPFGIITIDTFGNFSTFSPELIGQKSEEYNDFILGNVHDCSFRESTDNPAFKKLYTDIFKGVALCKQSCPYFSFCGGGAPSNKLFENGTFNSTETLYCNYNIQIPLEITLKNIEKLLL